MKKIILSLTFASLFCMVSCNNNQGERMGKHRDCGRSVCACKGECKCSPNCPCKQNNH